MSTLTGLPTEPATDPQLSSAPIGRGGRGRSVGRRGVQLAGAVLTGALVAAGAFALTDPDPVDALGPGVVTVEVGIDHSRFDLGPLRVREGTVVRFIVRNDDPIDHELIVGESEVHRRHADGTEGRHPPVPGEVSVAPGDTGTTFYEFDRVGTITYACHLPGHVAFGMAGEIEVVPT